MELHGILDKYINNSLHHFPEDLQEPYPSIICITLGGKDQDCPSQICRDSSLLPHELDQLHKFHPFL